MAEKNVNVMVDFPEAKKFLDEVRAKKGNDYTGAVILAMIGKLKSAVHRDKAQAAILSSLVFMDFLEQSGLVDSHQEIFINADKCVQLLLNALPPVEKVKDV